MSLAIRTKGIDAIIETLNRWQLAMPDILDVVTETLALEGQQRAKQTAPVRTGYLRDHINVHYDGQAHHRIVSEAGYSGFMEFGFQHYQDGFIPGRFYMTGALGYIGSLISGSSVVRDILTVGLKAEIATPSEDVY